MTISTQADDSNPVVGYEALKQPNDRWLVIELYANGFRKRLSSWKFRSDAEDRVKRYTAKLPKVAS